MAVAVLETSRLCQSGRMQLNREPVSSSEGGPGTQQVSQLGRDARRGQAAQLTAAALAAEWHRGLLHGQRGQGQPCPREGLEAESEQEGFPESSVTCCCRRLLSRGHTRRHSTHPGSRAGECLLLPSSPPAWYREVAATIPRGKAALHPGTSRCSERHLCEAVRVEWGEMTNVGDSFTNDAAPGSPPCCTGGGEGSMISHCSGGEDAGLCPHGTHTPTPQEA